MSKYLSAGFLIVLFLYVLVGPVPLPTRIGGRDFRAYWSAAKLLAQSKNFADEEQLLLVEQEQTGWNPEYAVVTWNPPWLLALLLPYTAVPFARASWLWMLTNITIVFTGSILVWKTLAVQVSSQRWNHLAPIVSLLFLPTLIAFLMGQVNTLVFLGLAGFLFFTNRNQLFVAGLCLVLTLVKPHLVYLTLPIILLHMVWTRRDYRVLAGLIVGVAALTAIVFALRPSFLTDYTQTVSQGSLLAWETPTLGGILAYSFGWEWAKLMGIIILPITIWLWWRYKDQLELTSWVMATVLISVITAPFGWGYDVIVLLLPLLQIFIWIAEGQYRRAEAIGWATLLIGINLAAIYQRTFEISELQAYWIPIILAFTYFLAYHRQKRLSK